MVLNILLSKNSVYAFREVNLNQKGDKNVKLKKRKRW